MMLYREEYYDEFTDKKGITDVLIRKNRNWPIWNIELMFNKNNQKFYTMDNRFGSGVRWWWNNNSGTLNSVEDVPF
jgi:replicative DNA helicase